MARPKIDRTGEEFKTNDGYIIKIIEYNNANDVTIQFQDEYKTILKHRKYEECANGRIRNPYARSLYKHGFIGQGRYKTKENDKTTKEYEEWKGMFRRGFDEEYKRKHPTYKDVTVDKRFYCFQDYCEWREQNYYRIEGENMHLDKDILCKGNKIYSPDTCIFVPERINKLFIKSDAIRGKYPIGVTYHKSTGKYMARCNILIGREELGIYDTPEEAFLVYKEFKEAYIKHVADEYKGRIPDRLYEAMYDWKVEIDD